MADGFEGPKGRMLLFWGCGAKPGPGQPVVIDFSKLAAGQMPPNLFTSTLPRIREITAANSAAYAGWPNGTSSKQPPKTSSLPGAHRLISNIGPDIAFSPPQDYNRKRVVSGKHGS